MQYREMRPNKRKTPFSERVGTALYNTSKQGAARLLIPALLSIALTQTGHSIAETNSVVGVPTEIVGVTSGLTFAALLVVKGTRIMSGYIDPDERIFF